jgi:hypothetical protein
LPVDGAPISASHRCAGSFQSAVAATRRALPIKADAAPIRPAAM